MNPILYVFTKEYKEEVEYFEFLKKIKPFIKLNCNSEESIDSKIDRLRKKGFKSNCHIDIGKFID